MDPLPHNVAPLADPHGMTTDALPSISMPPEDIAMADEDGDELLPPNGTKANNDSSPSPVPGSVEEPPMATPPNSFDGAALPSGDRPGIVGGRDGSTALNGAIQDGSVIANEKVDSSHMHTVDSNPRHMDAPMSIGSAEPGVALPDPLNAGTCPSPHAGCRSDSANQNEPQGSDGTTDSDMHTGDANTNSDAGTSGGQGISPSPRHPTASNRPKRSVKLTLPKDSRGSKIPREDESGTGGESTREVLTSPKRVAVPGPIRHNYESLKANYESLLRRSKIQSEIGIQLQKEKDQLLAEQEAKFDEYKLVYEKEITNLRNDFKAGIEEVQAQSTEERTNERDIEREKFQRETDILRTEIRYMNDSFTQRLNSGIVEGVTAVKAALEEKNNKLMDDLAELRSHNETLEQKIQEMGAAASKEDQWVRAEAESLKQERDDLVASASAMNQKYNNLENQNEHLTAQISDIRLQFQSEVEKRENAILDLRRRLSTLHPMSTQMPPNASAGQTTGSADGFINTPPQGSATNSNARRHDLLQSNSTPIGVVPLQPASSETGPSQMDTSAGGDGLNIPPAFTFDMNNTDVMAAMIKETLRQMGISEAKVTKTRKRTKCTPKDEAIKAEKESMSQEADNSWKAIIRETWKEIYDVSTTADFGTYKPASEDEVNDCELEIRNPRDTWTLDFNKGWDRSRWNKLILRKVYERVLLKSRETGWNVPNVSTEYLMRELYGQVKRAREAWAQVQPRYQPSTGNLESPEEIMKRVEEVNTQRLSSVGSRSRRERKFKRRSEIIEKVIAIKLDPAAPDLKTWEYFREMLKTIGMEGMSSEEEGVETISNVKVPVFRVKLCTWRAPQIGEYFKYIDREGDNTALRGTRGTRMVPRIPIEDISTSPAPPGLPRKMYNPVWLDAKERSRPGWVIDELRISREAFELLTFATR